MNLMITESSGRFDWLHPDRTQWIYRVQPHGQGEANRRGLELVFTDEQPGYADQPPEYRVEAAIDLIACWFKRGLRALNGEDAKAAEAMREILTSHRAELTLGCIEGHLSHLNQEQRKLSDEIDRYDALLLEAQEAVEQPQ